MRNRKDGWMRGLGGASIVTAFVVPCIALVINLLPGLLEDSGNATQKWVSFASYLLSAGTFAVALTTVVNKQLVRLDLLRASVSEQMADLGRAVNEVRVTSAYLGEALPPGFDEQIAATRSWLRSINAIQVDGSYPIEHNCRWAFNLAPAPSPGPGRVGTVDLSWGICDYDLSWEIRRVSGASARRPDLVSQALLTPRVVGVDQAIAELARAGMPHWEHFYPVRDRTWDALDSDGRDRMREVEWLAGISPAELCPTFDLEFFGSDRRLLRTVTVRLTKVLIPAARAERRQRLREIDKRLDKMTDVAAEGLLGIYVASPADVSLVDEADIQSQAATIRVRHRLRYLLPLEAVRHGEPIDSLWRFRMPITKICRLHTLTFSVDPNFPRRFSPDKRPNVPSRVYLSNSEEFSSDIRLMGDQQWTLDFRGQYMYPGEVVTFDWNSFPPETVDSERSPIHTNGHQQT